LLIALVPYEYRRQTAQFADITVTKWNMNCVKKLLPN